MSTKKSGDIPESSGSPARRPEKDSDRRAGSGHEGDEDVIDGRGVDLQRTATVSDEAVPADASTADDATNGRRGLRVASGTARGTRARGRSRATERRRR